MNKNKLLAEFEPGTYAKWREVAEKSLKGAPFERKLLTKTDEGIVLQPIYTRDALEELAYVDCLPGTLPYLRGKAALGNAVNGWEVCQEIPCATPEALNRALTEDLGRGQNAVPLRIDSLTAEGLDPTPDTSDRVGDQGVSIGTTRDLSVLFDHISLLDHPLYLEAGASGIPLAAVVFAYLDQQGVAPSGVKGAIEFDPLAQLARSGTLQGARGSVWDEMASLVEFAGTNALQLKTIGVSSAPYHMAGADAVEELACALATGVAYLRELVRRGLDINQVAQQMRFSMMVGSHFFMEVAKLRAARIAWACAVEAFGGDEDARRMTLHARSSTWNKTRSDAHVNLVRTTAEVFAAAVGEADSIHGGFYDEPLGPPDTFSRRLARNTHAVLREESHLGQVVDPAGGSWFVEQLTDELAQKSWRLFQQIEQRGGMTSALEEGFVQQQVEQTASGKAAALASRKAVLVGTNMYPNVDEQLPKSSSSTEDIYVQRSAALEKCRAERDETACRSALEALTGGATDRTGLIIRAIAAAQHGATLGEITKALHRDRAAVTVKPLRPQRGAEGFEALRHRARAFAERTGEGPRVFLANVGTVAQHKARADFSADFFEVGGFEILRNDGFATPQLAAAAAVKSGAPIAVICSTDDQYPTLVPEFIEALGAERPSIQVVLAGYPKDQINAHKGAGVNAFIHIKANVFETLDQFLKHIGA